MTVVPAASVSFIALYAVEFIPPEAVLATDSLNADINKKIIPEITTTIKTNKNMLMT